jgi:carbon-monoxide dehydrogenase large subunit
VIPLPAAADCSAALAAGAPTAHRGSPHNLLAEFPMGYGDVDAAFEKMHGGEVLRSVVVL